MKNNERTAFVAIVGRPNVGKSSIMNHLLGQKVAIVSPKPQTTRTRIMGVLTKGADQFVFIDTPGMHKPHNLLGEHMVKAVGDAVSDVDLCLMTVDASYEPTQTEARLIESFKKRKIPVILVLNKIDLLEKKDELLSVILKYTKLYDFAAVVPVSAKNGDGLDDLLMEISKFAVSGNHFFDDETLTDQPERVIAAELLREKFLRILNEEVPHGIAVAIEKFHDREESDILDIEATIYCERESHKGIIIGKGGQTLKIASTRAREDMEKFFECKVNLQCWVKVKEDWRNRGGIIHTFGLD